MPVVDGLSLGMLRACRHSLPYLLSNVAHCYSVEIVFSRASTMKSLLFSLAASLALTSVCAANDHATSAVAEGPKVILKLDDMQHRSGKVPDTWQRVYNFAVEREIPISVGIICRSLDGETPEYFDVLKVWDASGLVEFWNHGYDHKQWSEGGVRLREFAGTSYEHQFAHLQNSQDLAQAKLGLSFVSFGAGFNSTDATTVKALEAIPAIRVWLYGQYKEPAGKLVLKRNYKVNLEHKTGQLDLNQFQAAFSENALSELLVLQGHPMLWDDAEFVVFQQIIDFLEAQNVSFILPRDCLSQ